MIIPFEHYLADKDCPELYQAFNTIEAAELSTTMSDGPQDADTMDAETYSLYLAYGDSFGD